MSNRTFNICGLAYGESAASMTISLDGTTVFEGAVTTLPGPVPTLPDPQLTQQIYTLCSFELPVDFVGNKPMTCTVTNGTVIFADMKVNFVSSWNPIYTTQELKNLTSNITLSQKMAIFMQHANPPLSDEDQAFYLDRSNTEDQRHAFLVAHACNWKIDPAVDYFKTITSEPRINTVFNGVPAAPSPADRSTLPGTWWWTLQSGDTLAHDLAVPLIQ